MERWKRENGKAKNERIGEKQWRDEREKKERKGKSKKKISAKYLYLFNLVWFIDLKN